MAEYASNAKANTGVSLGAVGTGLGVAALLGANGNGGLLSGILGGKISAVATAATNGINTLGASLTALQNTVAGITSVVIPKSAICPEVMPRYNSWTAPTTTTTGS